MNKNKYRFISLLALLLLSACGTLEVGIERSATPQQATMTAIPQATNTPLASTVPEETVVALEQTLTPMPTPAPLLPVIELRVAFIEDGDVWLWDMGTQQTVALTHSGGADGVRISDDGEAAAFVRNDELWAVHTDGSDERLLLSATDFAAMETRESFDLDVALNRFDWVPGAHTLAFNTRLRMEIGLFLNDDLRLVDADTREQTLLLPPGQGGEFYYAPDGRQVAVVTAASISLLNADGGNRRDVFNYAPVSTYSEFQYYVQPVWAADSASLLVAVPPANPLAQPSQPSAIWRIPTDQTPASLLGNFMAGPQGQFAFAPDFNQVAYLALPEGVSPGGAESLLLADLDGGETVAYYPGVYQIYGWAPDSQHLAFLSNSQPPQAQIGQPGGAAVPAHGSAEVAAIDVNWVDAQHYAYLAQSVQGWSILLGQVGASSVLLADLAGAPPAYDFAGRVLLAETE